MQNLLILSSPNNRGIHQYAIYLSSLIPNSCLIYPKSSRHFWIFWEFFVVPLIILVNRTTHVYLCNSRVSPLVLLLPSRRYTIVIHDYIDNIILGSPSLTVSSLFSARRIYHTLLFTIALRVCSSTISNSHYTHLETRRLLPVTLPNQTIEPRPSFYESLTTLSPALSHPCNPTPTKTVLIVTGKSNNKSFERYLLLLLSQLDVFVSSGVNIHIIGISERELTASELSILKKLRCYIPISITKCLPEDDLIYSYLVSSLFITLSSSEGFGIPFRDSLAFGISTIYTSIPAYLDQLSYLRHTLPPLYQLSSSNDFLSSVSDPRLSTFLYESLSLPVPDSSIRVSQYLSSVQLREISPNI